MILKKERNCRSLKTQSSSVHLSSKTQKMVLFCVSSYRLKKNYKSQTKVSSCQVLWRTLRFGFIYHFSIRFVIFILTYFLDLSGQIFGLKIYGQHFVDIQILDCTILVKVICNERIRSHFTTILLIQCIQYGSIEKKGFSKFINALQFDIKITLQ